MSEPYMTCSAGCEGEYSATPGDYFWKDNMPFSCSECGEPMMLVKSVVSYVVLADRVTVDTLETFATQQEATRAHI
jgi:hypothetical protein